MKTPTMLLFLLVILLVASYSITKPSISYFHSNTFFILDNLDEDLGNLPHIFIDDIINKDSIFLCYSNYFDLNGSYDEYRIHNKL